MPAEEESAHRLGLDEMLSWIGRSETVHDTLAPTPLHALNAMLDRPPVPFALGSVVPPLWHWLYFLPLHRQSDIGPDGHARRGGFLPPVPLPRRMWAGSQFEFHAPLHVGDRVTRTSTIADVSHKLGRSGPLVFVKVRHELRCEGAAADAGPALVEFHDIVYRDAKRPGDVEPARVAAPVLDGLDASGASGAETLAAGTAWRRDIVPDDVLLFRYSALTFNGHRIHYDRRYVTEVEAYPGLVVHGPLIATLLLDLLRRQLPQADVAQFRFKALRPTFDLHPFSVQGRLLQPATASATATATATVTATATATASSPAAHTGQTVQLWAQDHQGWLTMDAQALLR